MSDDYHFAKDPATLIEARLTKEEAAVVAAYRNAKDSDGWPEGTVPFVMVVPVSREMLTETGALTADRARVIEQAGQRAVIDAALGLLTGVQTGVPKP